MKHEFLLKGGTRARIYTESSRTAHYVLLVVNTMITSGSSNASSHCTEMIELSNLNRVREEVYTYDSSSSGIHPPPIFAPAAGDARINKISTRYEHRLLSIQPGALGGTAMPI